jgi:uncharacterized membrane protein
MLNSISPLGWVLIIFLAIFILALNLGLFFGIKNKPQNENWITKMSDAAQTLQNPFTKESDRIKKLSEEIEKLKSKNKV